VFEVAVWTTSVVKTKLIVTQFVHS